MEVKIKFTAEIFIDGDNVEEIERNWLNLHLWHNDATHCGVHYCGALSVIDTRTNKDVSEEVMIV